MKATHPHPDEVRAAIADVRDVGEKANWEIDLAQERLWDLVQEACEYEENSYKLVIKLSAAFEGDDEAIAWLVRFGEELQQA